MNAALRGGKAGGRLGLGMASLTPRACVNSLERRSGRAGPKPKPLPRRAHLVKATESEPEEGEEPEGDDEEDAPGYDYEELGHDHEES